MENRSRNWNGRKSSLEVLSLGLVGSKSRAFASNIVKASAKVSKADGHVCKDEIRTVSKLITEELKFETSIKSELINVFNEAKDSEIPFEKNVLNIYTEYKSQPDLLLDSLDFLLDLAYSDLNFCSTEERLIQSTVKIFQVEQKIFRMLQRGYHLKIEGNFQSKSVSNHHRTESCNKKNEYFNTVQVFPEEVRQLYALVNSNPGDSLEMIRLNYQAIAKNARPSQLSINALPNEKVLKAQEKYALATQAYRQILKERGGER